MADSVPSDPPAQRPAGPGTNAVFEAKFRPPAIRPEWIDRPRLLQIMSKVAQQPVVLVAAPAGYGKSTLTAQWVQARPPDSIAWVYLDPADNDPTRLWTHLSAALERLGCKVDDNAAEFIAMSGHVVADRVVPRLLEALVTVDRSITLVLDDCHVLKSSECWAQLGLLIENLPSHTHLLLISRADPMLRLGRLRVEGRLGEIRTGDLSFNTAETRTLLTAYDIDLSASALDELVRQTEGWPAATYLACLSLIDRDEPEDFVRGLSGSDRFIADYLSEEVLSRQDAELRGFILDMSAFDRFDVDLANFVTQTRSARSLLNRLERTNLFLIPLPGDASFRFHHLFGTFALSALESESPERVLELHRRGARWFTAHGQVEDAIGHALAAGDSADAAAMMQAHWLEYFDAGRSATVIEWLGRLRGTPADDGPAATVTAAWMAALTGDQPEMRRRLARLEAMLDDRELPDGTKSPHSALLLIRGLFGFDGPDRMLADAREAVTLEQDAGNPWFAVARAALGHAAFVVGDLGLARTRLGEAARAPAAPITIRLLALGMLALCAAEQENPVLSAQFAAEAMEIVTEHAMQAMPQVTFAYTAYGRTLADLGRLVEAQVALREGVRERRQRPGLSPWPLVHHLLVMASVAARSGDEAAAAQLLAEIDELTPWADASMAVTRSRVDDVRRLVDHPTDAAAVGDPLTPREQEILRRLQGDQTLREIAADLYVSHNTVKTLTLSVYRKLGAHSRTEAVALARERRRASQSE